MKGTKLVVRLVVGVVACMSPGAAEGASQQAAAPQETPPQETASPGAIDTLVGRVALYPDALLGQILMCAESPFQVRELAEWLAANPDLKGSAIQEGAEAEGFDPRFVALSAFPQVVEMMSTDLEWTRQLGEAFATDRSAVFESIQRLRAQAMALGNLQSTPQQHVVQDTTQSGQQVIIIQPANPQVVYVPQYNPQVVYTTPAPTTVVVEDDDSDEAAAAVIGFTTGVIIGAWANPYYGPYGWYGGIYMYDDAWDDWYDHREDMWEDWQDHREEVEPRREERQAGREERQTDREERRTDRQEGDRRTDRQEGERATTRQEGGTERAATRQQGGSERATARQQGGSERATTQARGGWSPSASYGTRGYSLPGTRASRPQSGTRSGAFSGYGSGSASRAASFRGRSSMGSMGRRGGGRRR